MPIIKTPRQIAEMIPDGATLMIGGFMAVGTPDLLMDALVERKIKNITMICNDTGFPNRGVGKLIRAGAVKKVIASHFGTNPETGQGFEEGRIEVIPTPQGTLIEQIRVAGAGLGGVLTPTGIGTVVAEGKSVVVINEREYLLELPLTADFALIEAEFADRVGNLFYHGTTRNFNPIMATSAQIVVAQVDKYLEDEFLNPDCVHTPGIFVDYVVKKEN